MTNEELAKLVEDIGTNGAAGDGVLSLLAKGLTDAHGHLARIALAAVDLAKGKGKPADEEDEDDDSDDEDGDSEGDGKPGYQDMAMAVPAGTVSTTPTGEQVTTLDMTTWILETGDCIRTMQKGISDQAGQIGQLVDLNRKLLAQNAQLSNMVEASANASTALLVPLAKAMVETRNGLLQTAAPGITPKVFPRNPVPVVVEAAPPVDYIGGDKRTELQILAKAMNHGAIDIASKELFRRTRRFSTDDTRNAELRAKVDAIVQEVAAR